MHRFIRVDYGIRGIAVDALGPAAGTTTGATEFALELGGESRQVVRDRRSLRITIACGAECTSVTSARLTINGRALATWTGQRATIPQGATRGFRLTIPATKYRRLRTALRAGKRARLTVRVAAMSTSGDTSSRTRTWEVVLPDAATVRAEKAMTTLVYESYGDSGPIVTCTKRSSTRWTCSFTAYTGGGQLCEGVNAGTVRRSGTRYRASVDRTRVTCREA